MSETWRPCGAEQAWVTAAEAAGGDLIEALARGLWALDCHKWHTPDPEGQWEGMRLHYRRDAERFLLPHVAPQVARAAAWPSHPDYRGDAAPSAPEGGESRG